MWDRHIAALEELEDELAQIDTETWRSLSPEGVIDRFMIPHMEYFKRNRNCLVMMSVMPHDEARKKHKHSVLRKVIDTAHARRE